MSYSSDDLLLLVRRLNPLRSSLTVLMKKLETFVKELGIDPRNCITLSFPQLGGSQEREPTVKGILTDNAQRLCVLICVADLVAKCLTDEHAKARETCDELHRLSDAIHFVLNSHGGDQVEKPIIQEDLEDSINDDCRCWLQYFLKREPDGPEEIYAVRNYVICGIINLWADAFISDLQYLAGRVTPTEAITHEKSEAVTCCVTITTMEEEERVVVVEEKKEAKSHRRV